MRDDIADIILGCRCLSSCCCKKSGPATDDAPAAFFQQAGRGQPPLAIPESSPFIPPPPPSYDSPQRPGAWGAGSLPGVAATPPTPPRMFNHKSIGPAGAPPGLADDFYAVTAQDNSGQETSVAEWVNARIVATVGAVELRLAQRQAYTPSSSISYDPWDEYNPLGEIRATADSPVGPLPAIDVAISSSITRPSISLVVLPPEKRRDTGAFPWQSLPWLYDFAASVAQGVGATELGLNEQITYPEYDQTLERWEENARVGVNDAPMAEQPQTVTERRGPLTTAIIGTIGNRWGIYAFAERAETETGEAYTARYWTVAKLSQGTTALVLAVTENNPVRFGWPDFSSRLNSLPITPLPRPAPPWTGRNWLTPNRRVSWIAPTPDLSGQLTAYGRTFTGGTWAGLRLPVTPADLSRWAVGQPDVVEGVILHELGDTVSAIWPDGTLETCTRATFEAQVLRCGPGEFQGFSPIGLGFNSWPPEWAWAVTGGEDARAVVAWDAWRDSTRQAWPGRPRRRGPSTPLPDNLRPPLGLALATTGRVPRHEEPLERYSAGDDPDAPDFWQGQRPSHVPLSVQVLDGGQWVDNPVALDALEKRALYAPARQPEELDDSTHIQGQFRIPAWAGEAMPSGGPSRQPDGTVGVLLIRARVRAGQLPRLTVDGIPATATPLGRNAGVRGWQPFLITWGDVDYTVPRFYGITVTTDVPLSRLLLGRAGTGQPPENGGGDGG